MTATYTVAVNDESWVDVSFGTEQGLLTIQSGSRGIVVRSATSQPSAAVDDGHTIDDIFRWFGLSTERIWARSILGESKLIISTDIVPLWDDSEVWDDSETWSE